MRFEIKYIVHKSKLDRLREMVRPFVQPDKRVRHTPDNTYTVRSLYFDTPDLLYYYEKIEGVPNRLKLRMRTYDRPEAEAPMFFEIKRKHRVPMTKNRAPFKYATALDILKNGIQEEDFPYADPERIADCQRFMFHLHRDNLAPTVLVVYDREPYEAVLDNSVRITFDKNLRSGLRDEISDIYDQDLKMVMRDHFILEVKYNTIYPQWMRVIANSLDIKQVSASKYCMSMDNHKEVFQRDQWNKVISFRNSIQRRA